MRGLLLCTLAMALAAAAAACGGDACDSPSRLVFSYSCEPQASTANACAGGPMVGGVQHDADKNYPVGCFAGHPACVDGETVIDECECISGFAGHTWACKQ
jgi:hypothetical protein